MFGKLIRKTKKLPGQVNKTDAENFEGVLDDLQARIESLEAKNADERYNETLRKLYGLYYHIEKLYHEAAEIEVEVDLDYDYADVPDTNNEME